MCVECVICVACGWGLGSIRYRVFCHVYFLFYSTNARLAPKLLPIGRRCCHTVRTCVYVFMSSPFSLLLPAVISSFSSTELIILLCKIYWSVSDLITHQNLYPDPVVCSVLSFLTCSYSHLQEAFLFLIFHLFISLFSYACMTNTLPLHFDSMISFPSSPKRSPCEVQPPSSPSLEHTSLASVNCPSFLQFSSIHWMSFPLCHLSCLPSSLPFFIHARLGPIFGMSLITCCRWLSSFYPHTCSFPFPCSCHQNLISHSFFNLFFSHYGWAVTPM